MNYLKILPVIILLAGCYSSPKPEKTGLEGKEIPIFDLLLLDSATHLNTKNIPGDKPFVLFYVSPECPYCKTQMQGIIEDMNSFKDIQFYVITNWPIPEMKKFANNFQLNKYSNVTVGTDYKNFLEDYFQTRIVPFTAIYSKNKKLNKAFAGKIYPKEIKNAING